MVLEGDIDAVGVCDGVGVMDGVRVSTREVAGVCDGVPVGVGVLDEVVASAQFAGAKQRPA
jgi:hypothetical protein